MFEKLKQTVRTIGIYHHHQDPVIKLADCHDVLWVASTRLSLPVDVSALTIYSAKLLYSCNNTVKRVDKSLMCNISTTKEMEDL